MARMTTELHDGLAKIFDTWPRIDLAFSLPSGNWIRPDAASGKHRHLAGLDRGEVDSLERELWARALRAGQGIHWRPSCGVGAAFAASYALLDDLDSETASSVLAKYRGVGVETSDGSFQTIIATSRCLTRLEQHQLQAAMVQRLLAAGRSADRGACGAGQFARLPGTRHPGHGGRVVRLLSGSGSADHPLDPDSVLCSSVEPPMPAGSLSPAGIPVLRPGVPAGAQRTRGKAAIVGPAVTSGGSERDFAWVCEKIRGGANETEIIETLAAAALARGKRRDESRALEYAMRTVKKAQAVLAR